MGRAFRVGVRLRREVALEGVSLRVAPGSTVGLVGPNGSGKSTLLRILAGVDRASSGSAQVLGGDPADRDVRRRTAYLPDGAPFPAELSSRAALDLVAALAGMGRSERKSAVPAMLERVGLGDRARTRLGAFSRGMHRRFGLAQAFLGTPELVLLDEPTAGLDAPGFRVLADLLTEARTSGCTVLLASHVPSDLVDHCDELVLLRRGRVVRSGTPDQMLGRDDAIDVRVRAASSAESDVTAALDAAGLQVERARPARRSLLDLYEERGPSEDSSAADRA